MKLPLTRVYKYVHYGISGLGIVVAIALIPIIITQAKISFGLNHPINAVAKTINNPPLPSPKTAVIPRAKPSSTPAPVSSIENTTPSTSAIVYSIIFPTPSSPYISLPTAPISASPSPTTTSQEIAYQTVKAESSASPSALITLPLLKTIVNQLPKLSL
jgi:hypothetical protein